MPPPPPLLAGIPTAPTQSPAASYIPHVVITDSGAGFLVDPDRRVIPAEHPAADLCFPDVDDAVAAARAWLHSSPAS